MTFGSALVVTSQVPVDLTLIYLRFAHQISSSSSSLLHIGIGLLAQLCIFKGDIYVYTLSFYENVASCVDLR